jgi:hypothetical protein
MRSPRIERKEWWQKVLGIFTDKDSRTNCAWWCSGFGLLMIGGYYLWLGFTPSFGLGQATLLLLEAFLIGGFVTGYFALVLFAPAIAYRALDIEIDDFPKARQKHAIASLALRSVAAQAGAMSFMFLVTLLVSVTIEGDALVYIASCLVVFVCSVVVILKLPRTTSFGGSESLGGYCGSLAALGFSGLVEVVMLFTMYSIPPAKDRVEGWFFIVGLVVVVVFSAAIGTLRKNSRWGGVVMGAFVFIYLLVGFNSGTMPFKVTAVHLGIAVAQPVELVLPGPTCTLVKQALSNGENLSCDGPEAGRLKNMHLLNTLGERWVIREEDRPENIIFDGKGVVVRKLPPAPAK